MITDDVMVSLSAVLNAIKMVKKEGVEKLDPLIITQASSKSKFCALFYSELIFCFILLEFGLLTF